MTRKRKEKNIDSTRSKERQYKANLKAKDPRLYLENTRRIYLMTKYGISIEEYDAMAFGQNNLCAICKTSGTGASGRRLNVDHDHVTGRIRGLLCHGCNVSLGYFKDSSTLLQAAIDYLNQ